MIAIRLPKKWYSYWPRSFRDFFALPHEKLDAQLSTDLQGQKETFSDVQVTL
jgi:hypothetical protein